MTAAAGRASPSRGDPPYGAEPGLLLWVMYLSKKSKAGAASAVRRRAQRDNSTSAAVGRVPRAPPVARGSRRRVAPSLPMVRGEAKGSDSTTLTAPAAPNKFRLAMGGQAEYTVLVCKVIIAPIARFAASVCFCDAPRAIFVAIRTIGVHSLRQL